MSNVAATPQSPHLIEALLEHASAAPAAAETPASKQVHGNQAAPSLKTVLNSSRVRAWVPQHLIDSVLTR